MMLKYVLPLLALAAMGFAVYFVVQGYPAATVQDPPKKPAVKAPGAKLAGSGIVEPVTQNIAVGSPLPGIVTWVIDASEIGKEQAAGKLLFRLDDRNLNADLVVKNAALAAAEAQLQRLKDMPRKEEVAPLEAKVKEYEFVIIEAEKNLEAITQGLKDKTSNKGDWGRAKSNLETLKVQKFKSEQDLALVKAGAWKADIDVSVAAKAQAKAQVDQVKIELDRLEVRAPITSTLLQVNVRVGEYVGAQPNQNLLLLGDLSHLYVRVDIDEHDATAFRDGMPAIGYLRGQPDISFPMEWVRTEPYLVPRKSLTGDNTERVDTRVKQVVYKIRDNAEKKDLIYVGQQMDVFIGEALTQKK
jgi:HlyD family secretion protein